MKGKSISIVLILIYITACTNNIELFPYEDLRNAVGQYVDNVGAIDNPYDEPTTTTIIFSKENNDTLITMTTNFGGYTMPPEPDKPIYENRIIKGACYFHNRVCIFVYYGFDNLPSSLVNESKLTLPREKYDAEYYYMQRKVNIDGFIISPRSYRKYILNRPEPLELVEKSIGPTESE